jgi:hypothetical protein
MGAGVTTLNTRIVPDSFKCVRHYRGNRRIQVTVADSAFGGPDVSSSSSTAAAVAANIRPGESTIEDASCILTVTPSNSSSRARQSRSVERHGYMISDTNSIKYMRMRGGYLSSIAGSTIRGSRTDCRGVRARFAAPGGMVFVRTDAMGDGCPALVFVADTLNHRIQCVEIDNVFHTVHTVCGSLRPAYVDHATDGLKASFFQPVGIAVVPHDVAARMHAVIFGCTTEAKSWKQNILHSRGPSGEITLLVADLNNDALRIVHVVWSGSSVHSRVGTYVCAHALAGSGALGWRPTGVVVSSDGQVFFPDQMAHCIRHVDRERSRVSVVCGVENIRGHRDNVYNRTGTPRKSVRPLFDNPSSVCLLEGPRTELFVLDVSGIRRVLPSSGHVYTIPVPDLDGARIIDIDACWTAKERIQLHLLTTDAVYHLELDCHAATAIPLLARTQQHQVPNALQNMFHHRLFDSRVMGLIEGYL